MAAGSSRSEPPWSAPSRELRVRQEATSVRAPASPTSASAAGFEPRVVNGLLSGIHARDSSHFELLSAFLPGALEPLYTLHVAAGGYRGHEFGDSTLVLG